jgi:hypothetical protein
VAIGLPLLEAMLPARAAESMAPMRMVLIGLPLSLYAPNFFPETAGRDYEPSRYLKLLERHREQFTVFSGMSHRYPVGHHPEICLFTGVPPEWIRSPADIRNSISLDQEVAARIGDQTRFPSLILGFGAASWNKRGVNIPTEHSAVQAFRELFIQGTPAEEARQLQRIQEGQSILDDVRDQLKSINRRLGDTDRQRVDLYLSSVREAEKRLRQDERWCHRPKPTVKYAAPTENFNRVVEQSRQWYDIVHLALQTDSTRVVTLMQNGYISGVDGVTLTTHDASHHGKDPGKLDQLARIEDAEMRLFGEFLDKLKQSDEGPASLLDRTVVFITSNMGDSSSHANDNLPIILAGGGFKHQGHVAYDRANNTLLSNLYVRMLHQMNIETDSFGSSNGVISDV